MPATTDVHSRATILVARLESLPVRITAARVEHELVPVASYPGGLRPSAHVVLEGGGQVGRGEHVAWEEAAHRAFAARLAALGIAGAWSVEGIAVKLTERLATAYERAAVECAVIDLALRQAHTSLFGLAGQAPRPIRYVGSYDGRVDPMEGVARLRACGGDGLELKVDVDSDWNPKCYEKLAALGTVAILDFKGQCTHEMIWRAHNALPAALLEDPFAAEIRSDRALAALSPAHRARASLDASIVSPADIPIDEGSQPAAINVKIPRMGGLLTALRAFAVCEVAGIETYVGGMFEVDVGRHQARALASLFCADGPNDLAPLAAHGSEPAWPARLTVEDFGSGFATEQR